MGLYGDVIFPAIFDLGMRKPHIEVRRRAVLEPVAGRVLEIGVGTGLNLPCYPAGVDRVVTVEPNPGMNKRLARRAEASGVAIEQHRIAGESLPFGDGEFDFAVSTWTLCSVREPEAVVAELFRVLKPGGRFLFVEHGKSPDAGVHKWQRRLNPLQRRIADGCRLDLDVRALLDGSPFGAYECAESYLEKTPRFAGYLYEGSAVRPDQSALAPK